MKDIISGVREEDRPFVKECVEKCEDFFQTLEEAKEDIKRMSEDVFEKTGLPKSDFKKLAKIVYEQNLEMKRQELDELSKLYEEVMGIAN